MTNSMQHILGIILVGVPVVFIIGFIIRNWNDPVVKGGTLGIITATTILTGVYLLLF